MKLPLSYDETITPQYNCNMFGYNIQAIPIILSWNFIDSPAITSWKAAETWKSNCSESPDKENVRLSCDDCLLFVPSSHSDKTKTEQHGFPEQGWLFLISQHKTSNRDHHANSSQHPTALSTPTQTGDSLERRNSSI